MPTMQSSKPPQIIVIPSSLLQQQKAAPIKISPSQPTASPFRIITSSPQTLNKAILSPNSVSSQMTLNRAVLSPSLSTPLKMVQPSISTKPIAAVIGSKRPAPEPSPPTFDNDYIKFETEKDSQPVRKRANLDHLSPEERLMRRKLKNRVAAQTARDKKKQQTDEMEKLISDLQEEKLKLENDNNRLQATNTQLQIENANLLQENNQLRSRILNPEKTKTEVLELELPPSPVSLPPTSPQRRVSIPGLEHTSPLLAPICSPPLQPPESAALTYDPQQQEQGCSRGARLGHSYPSLQTQPGLSSRDLTPWESKKARADCLTVLLCALWCLVRTNLSSTSPRTPRPSSATQLPLKKRARMTHQQSWTPNVSLTPQPPE